MTREMMLQIVLEHVRRGGRFVRDACGRPALREGAETDMLGALIPQTLYYSTDRIETMTTYQLRDAGVWTSEELETIHLLDRIQAHHEEDEWEELVLKLLEGAGYEQWNYR